MQNKEKGSLSEEKLEEIFKDISRNLFAAILAAYDEKAWKEFYFTPQGLKVTSLGAKKAFPLGEIMVRQGTIDPVAVEKTLERIREKPCLFGTALADMHFADADQVESALRHQAELEVLDLYFWRRPNYEYTPGLQSMGSSIVELKRREAGAKSLSVKCHPLDIINAARRLNRDVSDMKRRLGRSDGVYRLTPKGREKIYGAGGFAKLGIIDQRVIVLIDGKHSLSDVFRKARVMWIDVMRVLDKLLGLEAVEKA